MGCKPKLRFPEFSGEWEKKTLGETLEATLGGGTPSRRKSSYWNGDIPWASVKDLDNNKYKESTVEFITEEGLNNSSSKLIPAESLIISTRMGLGRGFINKKPISINQDLKGLITNDMINIEFLYYWYKLKSDYIETLGKGSTVKGLRLEELHALSFSFPSLEEQQKIVSFLSKVDSKIDLLKKKQELWETYKKGIMQQIFSQKLRFKDENGEDYPDWEEKKLGDIFDERNEKGFVDLQLLSVTLKKGVIKRDEIEGKDNSSENKSNYKRVMPNDIPYNSMRMWQGASGVSQYEGIVSPAYTVLIPNVDMCSKYFGYYFKTTEAIYQFKKYSQGLTSDTWNLKYPLLSEIKIKFPLLLEQEKIANFLLELDKKITVISIELNFHREFKKGLLQQMFC